MRSCEAIQEEFSALLDGELPPDVRAEIETHLFGCAECLRALGGMKKVDDLYRAMAAVSAPADFEARLKQRLRPAIRRAPARKTMPRRLWPLALAAGLLVVLSFFVMRVQAPAPDQFQLTQAQETFEAPKRLLTEAETARAPAGAAPMAPPLSSMDQERSLDIALPAPPIPELADTAESAAAPVDAVRPRAVASPPAPPTAAQIAGRAFSLVEEVWQEQGYAGEPVMPLPRDSAAFTALCDAHPELLQMAALGPRVVFQLQNIWYRIEPAADSAPH